ncbi:MAG: type II toxin-antitoxin system VapC family toxin [Bauldia sp.]
MPFVLDASITAAWFLDEADEQASVAWETLRADSASVPSIWWHEIRNALLMAERRKRLSRTDVDEAWARLRLLRIKIDEQPKDDETRSLARRHALTFYGAAYLELALRLHYPLATAGRALGKAARSEHVKLIG